MSGQDITIVIPTYNRYSFLLRLLKYYDKYDHHFHYLILDSSSDELHSDVKPYLEIKNVMYKKYDASIFFAHKIADGCQSITTPFAVLCADDDFLIPIGILASRNFLMENVDYTSAHGFYFIHSNAEDTKKKRFTNNLLYEDDRLVKQDSATERIDAYLSGSISHVFYAVHRTELFQLIWTETKTYVSDWGLSELFPSCMSFVYGKMKKLPVFYASREPNDFIEYDIIRYKKMYSEDKINKAIMGIATHLSMIDGLSLDEAELVTRRSFDKYFIRLWKKLQTNPSRKNNSCMPIWKILKQKARIRQRFRLICMQGCHPSIYPKYMDDYSKLKQVVISSNTIAEEIHRSRKEISEQVL